MTRSFSEYEKKVIQEKVVRAAEELFTTQGFTKTTVSEIARAAGIGKGTFYLFFKSKEEVVWALHEDMHRQFHDELQVIFADITRDPERAIPAFMHAVFAIFSHPLIVKLQQAGDFDRLMRTMTHEQIEEHGALSLSAMVPMIEVAQRAGILIEGDPVVIAGTIRSVCFIGLHKEEIGEAVYPRVVEMLISLVAKGLTHKGQGHQ